MFDFLSVFQEDAEFVTDFDFLGVDLVLLSRSRMHLTLILLVQGHLNMTIYLVSFMLSVCFSDVNATEGSDNLNDLTAYFLRRMLKSRAGIGISHVPG